jgi:hypothetical protein
MIAILLALALSAHGAEFTLGVGGSFWLPGMYTGWAEMDSYHFDPAASPSIAVQARWRHWTVQPFVGLSTHSTFFTWSYDFAQMQLAMAEAGVAFGGRRA